ncbi:MAG: hypothetical protein ACI8T1_002116 [Verrucomicrobiales bacterium]
METEYIIPIMVIDILGKGPIPGKGWSQTGAGITQVPRQPAVWMLFDRREEDSGHASVLNAPQVETRIGIRQRCSFSKTWKEKPYSVEAWDGEAEETKVSPLGMPKYADWVLYPNVS